MMKLRDAKEIRIKSKNAMRIYLFNAKTRALTELVCEKSCGFEVKGTTLQGEIRTDSNMRIDGKVKGTINAKGKIIIGQTGIVEGDVICQTSEIEGTLEGKITCSEILSLKATAKLNGDILTKKLAIEPGAAFSGNCSW